MRSGTGDLREMLGVLGFGELEPLAAVGDPAAIDPQAAELLDQRERARAARDFEAADALRGAHRGARLGRSRRAQGPELVPRSQSGTQ